ncbi:MAG: HD domain-containing phosphohydrolase [Candidatus Omnitrophota bacterium]
MDNKKKPYDSLRLQISKASAMLDIGPKFSEAVSTNHLLSLIVKQTLDLMDAEVCIIWLKDKDSNLVARISFGLKGTGIQSAKISISKQLMKCIINKKGPTYIASLTKDPRVPFKKIIKREGLRSMLAAPLTVGDENIGVLMVCTKSGRRFHGTDFKIFNAIAGQAALATANIGLYDRMDKKARDEIGKMATLFNMSRSLSSAQEMNVALDIILEKVCVLTESKFCILKLMDRSRRRLVMASIFGLSRTKAKGISRFNDDIANKVLRGGSVLVINNVNTYFKRKIPASLKEHGIHSLIMAPLYSNKRRSGILSLYMPDVRIFEKEELDMIEMIAGFSSMVVDNSIMLERIRKDYLNTIKTLARIIDENDPYTRGHCEKVMKYSMMICKKMKLPERYRKAIKTASLLHDIGKIGIDLSILRKAERLSADDWKKIRLHPEIGARIVSQVGFLNDVVPIIKYHHSRYGGGGYPDPGRKEGNIPIGSRIITVADAYDAMTSDRPYRKAMAKEKAIEELKKCAGEQFDPEIVRAFISSALNR